MYDSRNSFVCRNFQAWRLNFFTDIVLQLFKLTLKYEDVNFRYLSIIFPANFSWFCHLLQVVHPPGVLWAELWPHEACIQVAWLGAEGMPSALLHYHLRLRTDLPVIQLRGRTGCTRMVVGLEVCIPSRSRSALTEKKRRFTFQNKSGNVFAWICKDNGNCHEVCCQLPLV